MNRMRIDEYLRRKHSIQMVGFFDLRYMVKLTGCVPKTLRRMHEIHLGEYHASYEVAPSWGSERFTENQLEYAAKASHQAIELFKFFHIKLLENGSFKEMAMPSIIEENLDKRFRKKENKFQSFDE